MRPVPHAWSRRPVAWLAAGAAAGTASVAILIAVSSLAPNMPDWMFPSTPGLVFGIVLGGLLHLSGPRPAWRIACYVVSSTVAHHLAHDLAARLSKPDLTWADGILAGALGSALLAAASMLLFPPPDGRWHAPWIVFLGSLGGSLLIPAVLMFDSTPWRLLILYVPWQAAVAWASARLFLAQHPPRAAAVG